MTGWQSTVVGFVSFGIASLALTVILFTVFFGTPEERAAKAKLQLWLDLQTRPPQDTPSIPIRIAMETLVGNQRIRRASFWFVIVGAWISIGIGIATDNDVWLVAMFGWIFGCSMVFVAIDSWFGSKQRLERMNRL